ncbi:hypothetical protein HBH70_061070 [Parastagonospora nodorum]|nr:hypothetical protein HBI79_050960 [Parastagonospora nodorum]KAH5143745.1 hypothetical protein HBH70_061070 [Parastagonospora nodorum]
MERRNSNNDEPARQPGNPDVFDDDYEIEPDEDDFMPSVSDGFRPANASGGPGDRQNHDRTDAIQRHASTSKPPQNDLRRAATRNSTAKVRDSMPPESRESRPHGTHDHGPSSPSPLAHRASVSSTGSFATTSNGENPFETGPSHPYGMYPQYTMGRTASVETASTERQPHRSMSLQRPTHPYAMYSQSGIDEGMDEPLPAEPAHPTLPPIQTAIPLGFPGHGNGYHRVLGPDGEEQDIIGPDGHTEQLPPYSRFPEEGPTKASLAAEASASRIIPAPTPVDPEDPFMTPASPVSPLSATFAAPAPALPSAPLLPSVTPARLPPQRPETQTGGAATVTSTYSSQTQIPAEPTESSSASLLTTEQGFSEKAEPTEGKVPWHKRKIRGRIPLGVLVVALGMFLILAVALGAAVGTIVTKKQNNEDKDKSGKPEEPLPQVSGSHGSLFDATPIPTPSGLGSLPTGGFSLPLGIPQESNPGCLTQANQYSAWSCKLTFAPLLITVNNTMTDEGPVQLASMRSGSQVPDGAILYGLQTPDLSSQALQLVLDLDYKAYGPAYHFQSRYDKLVILRPEELNTFSGVLKRQDPTLRQRFQVKPGDLPWYCYWNQTYIEGYIYAEDNSTAASFTFPTAAPSGSPSISYDLDGFLATATTGATPSVVTVAASASSASITPTPNARRDVQSDAAAPPRMPPYPRIVKIEERRLPNSPQPYCQQMLLLDDGKIAPATYGSNGFPKKILLQESDPSYDDYYAARVNEGSNSKRQDLQRRLDPSDSCHCQWMFK